MYRLHRLSSLVRSVNPGLVTHQIMLAISALSFMYGLGMSWMSQAGLGAAILRGIESGLAVFLGWAIGRELDPDYPWSAMVGAVIVLAVQPAVGLAHWLILIWLLWLLRLLARSTGRPATTLDSLFLLALTVWLSLGWSWSLAGLAALVFFLDAALPDRRRASLGYGLAAVLLGVWAVASSGGDFGDYAEISQLSSLAVVATAGTAAVFSLLILPPERIAAVGDISGTPLSDRRVQAARAIALLSAVGTLALLGPTSLFGALPLWSSLAGVSLYRWSIALFQAGEA